MIPTRRVSSSFEYLQPRAELEITTLLNAIWLGKLNHDSRILIFAWPDDLSLSCCSLLGWKCVADANRGNQSLVEWINDPNINHAEVACYYYLDQEPGYMESYDYVINDWRLSYREAALLLRSTATQSIDLWLLQLWKDMQRVGFDFPVWDLKDLARNMHGYHDYLHTRMGNRDVPCYWDFEILGISPNGLPFEEYPFTQWLRGNSLILESLTHLSINTSEVKS